MCIFPYFFLHFLVYWLFTMDPNEEFGIILDDLESDSDFRANIGPPNDSEIENEESKVPKGRGNSIGARVYG
jgi:hypothetical protein